jgi:hypothetical protein
LKCGEFGDDAFSSGFLTRKLKQFCVYIMTHCPPAHLRDTGIAGDLSRRVFEHGTHLFPALPAGTTWRD